jgi:hypothetical protein
MKLKIKIFIASLMLTGQCFTQDIDTGMLNRLKLNFVVPDMPAFKALNTDPSNLLRPSTVQALAVNMSSFNSNGKFIIPKAFALELSPALLLNAKKGPQQLKTYAENAVMNSFRISVGSNTDTSFSPNGRTLAAGIRISIINKGDPTTDTKFHEKVASLLNTIRTGKLPDAKKAFAAVKNYKGEDIDLYIDANRAEFDKFFESRKEIQEFFSGNLKKLKEDYRKEHWNDEKLDLAIALSGFSKDSLVQNTRFNNAQLWFTWATPLGKTNKAQLLLGFNAKVFKNLKDTVKATMNTTYSEFALPLRILIGTNRVKGFTEIQYSHISDGSISKLYANLGVEINLIDGIWANISGGINYNSLDKAASFVPQMNIKLTLPENFKVF